MWCSFPPPLSDDQLSAALDDTADNTIAQHLAGCAACRARLAQARSAEGVLRSQLHRWDCPPSQELADYHLGLVEQLRERSIVRHLDSCLRCTAELEELRVFLANDEPARAPERASAPVAPPRPSRVRWGELIARLVPRTPAVALRGAAEGPLIAEADGVTLVLEPQPAGEGQLRVAGQLVAEDQERWTGALVELRAGGALRGAAEIDDLGSFELAAVPIGPAELRVTAADGMTIVVPELELKR